MFVHPFSDVRHFVGVIAIVVVVAVAVVFAVIVVVVYVPTFIRMREYIKESAGSTDILRRDVVAVAMRARPSAPSTRKADMLISTSCIHILAAKLIRTDRRNKLKRQKVWDI